VAEDRDGSALRQEIAGAAMADSNRTT